MYKMSVASAGALWAEPASFGCEAKGRKSAAFQSRRRRRITSKREKKEAKDNRDCDREEERWPSERERRNERTERKGPETAVQINQSIKKRKKEKNGSK